MPWENSEEQMNIPREMRIHVQRVFAIPAPHNMPPPPQDTMGPFAPPPPPQPREQNEQPAVLHQFVPQPAPTQELEQPEQKMQMENAGGPVQMSLPWELTPEDLHIIHRTAQDAAAQRRDQQMDSDMQEVKTIVNTLAAAAAEAEAEAEVHAQAEAEADRRRAEANRRQAEEQRQVPQEAVQLSREPRTLLLQQDVDERPHCQHATALCAQRRRVAPPREAREALRVQLRLKHVKHCAALRCVRRQPRPRRNLHSPLMRGIKAGVRITCRNDQQEAHPGEAVRSRGSGELVAAQPPSAPPAPPALCPPFSDNAAFASCAWL
ncbi:hypothetical protein RR48_07571 [Papilio machaon]|uniref:Uncharacterized protein n=1 Tax=Papilio machaon TaxID=76193 RepID=A0A194QQC2_PAPMA|nr:hypothetical protein RR48_07571 [Papilio machaon]